MCCSQDAYLHNTANCTSSNMEPKSKKAPPSSSLVEDESDYAEGLVSGGGLTSESDYYVLKTATGKRSSTAGTRKTKRARLFSEPKPSAMSPKGSVTRVAAATSPTRRSRAPRPVDSHDTPPSYTPPVLRLVPTGETDILNRWLRVRPHIQVVTKVPVTSPEKRDLRVTPLRKLNPVPGRDFKFKLEVVSVSVTWDPPENDLSVFGNVTLREQSARLMATDHNRQTYRISLWNDADAAPKRLRLFLELTPHYSKVWKGCKERSKPPPAHPIDATKAGGALNTDICPTTADAENVAQEACELLDRYPFAIDESDFPEHIVILSVPVPTILSFGNSSNDEAAGHNEPKSPESMPVDKIDLLDTPEKISAWKEQGSDWIEALKAQFGPAGGEWLQKGIDTALAYTKAKQTQIQR
jgi:hypothetical protein